MLFSIGNNANTIVKELNNDLVKISSWDYQWKMSFNPEPSKQAHEVIFSRKTEKISILVLLLTIIMYRKLIYKNMDIVLDNHLSFEDHLKRILNKVNKTTGLPRKPHNILLRSSMLTIYKSFIRSHLDYGDKYDQAYNGSFNQILEPLQENACHAFKSI